MEIWDGYWEDGSLANIDLVRGEPIPNGIYHMVSEFFVLQIATKQEYLFKRVKPLHIGGYQKRNIFSLLIPLI